MVNCKGVSSTPKSPVNLEICRYCRTRMCEECYLAATSRSSKLQPDVPRHQHVCLACTRLHPEAKELRSPPRERRPSRLPRLNSAPVSGGPRIDSLSNMARERSTSTWSRSEKPEEQAADKPKKSADDRRRRRHTSAIAPTSRSVDFPCPSRPSRARQLLKANATELQAARRRQNATELQTSRRHDVEVPTSFSCDFTSIRDAKSTQKNSELAMTDLRRVPKPLAKAQSCDLTGSKPIFDMSDEPTALELSTVDLRLPKHKANIPTPTKRGRRVSAADPTNSALTPISIEHLAAIDAKLSSVELELKRYDVSPEQEKPVSSVESGHSSQTRENSEPVDLHLSTVDLRPRPRRHTTEKAKHGNWKSVEVGVKKNDGFAAFQRKKKAEPIDFHLSTFDLKPRGRTTESKPQSNQEEDSSESRKEEEMKAAPATPGQTTPMYSKDEPCDLAYLDNFRSYTV